MFRIMELYNFSSFSDNNTTIINLKAHTTYFYYLWGKHLRPALSGKPTWRPYLSHLFEGRNAPVSPHLFLRPTAA